jgi:lipoyl-dependent peroxiredoxin subunit D
VGLRAHFFFVHGEDEVSLEQLLDSLPEYAKDMKLNMSSLQNQAELTPQQTWGTIAACAMAVSSSKVRETLLAEAEQKLSPEALFGAKAAATVMGMNNVFYRFLHLVEGEKYKTIRAGLRMNIIRQHGTDPVDFELWCLAVSAINNCQACVQAHEKVLREKGVSEESIVASVRLAAVIHSLSTVLA